MSSRSCRSRRMSSLLSTTVTSLAGSRDRWKAAVRPTWPAPSISIFISACAPSPLHDFQIRVLQHEPFGALLLEIYLHACMRSLAFDREHHAFAEFAVAYPGSEPHAVTYGFHQRAASQRTPAARRCAVRWRRVRNADSRPHLFDHRRRKLLDEGGQRVV